MRTKEFDTNEALLKIANLFWRKGYEQVNYADIQKVSGLNRPSIYNAFGNKSELYKKALLFYMNFYGPELFLEYNKGRTFHESIKNLFFVLNKRYLNPELPPSCLSVITLNDRRHISDEIKQLVLNEYKTLEDTFCRDIKNAISKGEMKEKTNPHELAAYILCLIVGLHQISTLPDCEKKIQASMKNCLQTIALNSK